MTVQASKSVNRFNLWHGLVLLIGVLVFVLLLLANKTHLESAKTADLGSANQEPSTDEAEPATPGLGLLSAVPPGSPTPLLDSLHVVLDTTDDEAARADLFQAIVVNYKDQGRLDLAAVYAGRLAEEQPDARNLLVAGALFRNAGFIPHIQQDSALYRQFSDEALRHLRRAEELAPKSEDVLLELGLAMAESRLPELGMEGILKIRTVTELNPNNTEALYRLGMFSMDTRQFDKAEARFRQVLAIEPDNTAAQFLLGLACQQQRKTAEFKKIMTEVAAQNQDTALATKAKAMLNQP